LRRDKEQYCGTKNPDQERRRRKRRGYRSKTQNCWEGKIKLRGGERAGARGKGGRLRRTGRWKKKKRLGVDYLGLTESRKKEQYHNLTEFTYKRKPQTKGGKNRDKQREENTNRKREGDEKQRTKGQGIRERSTFWRQKKGKKGRKK